jgi:putative phage-type endonuclease
MHPKVKALLERPRIKQHTDSWYSERKIRLTASDVPAVLGRNPYCTKEEVFLRKTNQRTQPDRNPACDHGHKYEPLACKAYTEVTGIKCVEEDIGLVIHDQFQEFGASPDRVALEHPILVEVKCPFRRRVIPGEIPAYYMDQVEFQLACTGLDIVHFVQFIPGGIAKRGSIDITEKARDQQWWDNNFHTLREFWRDVVKYWEQNPDKKPPRKLVLSNDGTLSDKPGHRPQSSSFSMTTDMDFVRDCYDVTMQAFDPSKLILSKHKLK